MVKKKSIEQYKKYHSGKDDERLGLFVALEQKYNVTRVLYPGSFVHITPSLVFPDVVYVDSDKRAEKFFTDEAIHDFVVHNKLYREEPLFRFHKADYRNDFGERSGGFDLLISQYSGFVSQDCKKYLQDGGILVVNNSHGDASMASVDPDYEFVAVYKRRSDKAFSISVKELESYFIPKKDVDITKSYIENLGRGLGYTRNASGYIFRKSNK